MTRKNTFLIPFAIKRLLLQSCQQAKLSRGSLLLSPGMEVNHAWLLRSGLLKHYNFDRNGQRQVYHFYQKGDIVTLEEAFLEGRRSKAYLEVIEEAVLLPVPYLQFREISGQYPEMLIPLLQLALAAKKRVVIRNRLMQGSAYERYQRFTKVFPVQFLQVKDIAAYLHLDPTTLSKVKRSI